MSQLVISHELRRQCCAVLLHSTQETHNRWELGPLGLAWYTIRSDRHYYYIEEIEVFFVVVAGAG